MAGKWNYRTGRYEPVVLPKGAALTGRYDEHIQCAQCSRFIQYGQSFVSKEVHSIAGMGYAVCCDCYCDEFDRRIKYKEANK